MNYIKHLAGFFERVATDDRLNPTHISMYVSLFQFWNANRFQNPISISRNELMKISKISAKATYHKCMKELNDWQYLKYKPSYNPFKGSLVYLFNFQSAEQTSDEQALVADHTKIETSIEQAQEPYINIYKHNKQNIINLGEQKQKNEVQNLNGSISPLIMERGLRGEAEAKEKEKLRQKKKNVISNNKQNLISFSVGEGARRADEAAKERSIISNDSEKSLKFKVPLFSEVQQYFTSQKYPLVEAAKFYNYFQSNGWLVGGRTKMKDWQAAARNWMLNTQKFNSPPSPSPSERVGVRLAAKHLHAKQNKNYNEPL